MKTNPFDDFYPESNTVKDAAMGRTMAQLSLQLKLQNHLANARKGNRDSESRLVNRLGQIRRMVPSFKMLTPSIAGLVRASTTYLRTTGRTVDFTHPNPALWITTRSGKPRW